MRCLCCLQVQERFRHAYEEVKSTMAQLYSFFQHDSEEVQREWLKFTQKVLSTAVSDLAAGTSSLGC